MLPVAPIYHTLSALYAAQSSFSTRRICLSGYASSWFFGSFKPAAQLAQDRFYGTAQSESAACPSPLDADLAAGRQAESEAALLLGPIRSAEIQERDHCPDNPRLKPQEPAAETLLNVPAEHLVYLSIKRRDLEVHGMYAFLRLASSLSRR